MKSAMGWQLFGNTKHFSLLMCYQSLIFQSLYLPVNVFSAALVYLESLFILYFIASLDLKKGVQLRIEF